MKLTTVLLSAFALCTGFFAENAFASTQVAARVGVYVGPGPGAYYGPAYCPPGYYGPGPRVRRGPIYYGPGYYYNPGCYYYGPGYYYPGPGLYFHYRHR